MGLPITTNNIVLWYDFGSKFINYATGSANIYSVMNRIDGNVVSQSNTGLQPTWSSNAMGGLPGLVFSGNQYLIGSMFGNTILTGIPTMSISMAINPASAQFTVPFSLYWSQGVVNDPAFLFAIASNRTIAPQRFDDAGVGFDVINVAAAKYVANTVNILTATFDPTQMSISVNGKLIATKRNGTSGGPASGFTTLDTIVIGASSGNDPTPFDLKYTGSIGDVIVYGGEASTEINRYLLLKYSLPTS